ncbi:MAG: HAMP domain-containing protein [Elusimicrobia bacterium]|nr:HAMP domain-containing protein [Elusimicrobiota bacterium]
MKSITDISIKSKLLLSFGLMTVFTAAVIATAFSGIAALRSTLDLRERDHSAIVNLLQLRSNLNRIRGQMLEMSLLKDRTEQEKLAAATGQHVNEIKQGIAAAAAAGGGEKAVVETSEMRMQWEAYERTLEEEIKLARLGKTAELMAVAQGVQKERYERIRSLALQMADEAEDEMKKSTRLSRESAAAAVRLFLLTGIAALFTGLLTALLLTGNIVGPLAAIAAAAEAISKGEMAVELPSAAREDEVGALAKSFSRMSAYLRAMTEAAEQIGGRDFRTEIKPVSEKDLLGNAFSAMTANLRGMTRDIQNATQVLASSTGQMAASTTETASTVAEIATAVSQTTATVEEVKQTAQLSSQKSRQVSDSSQRAAQVAQDGQKAVEDVRTGMGQIKEQVESIAKNIVRLSEQSQTIGEITSTVGDLAEQSNLLAVNAAIEAAKAGEQGRGFAVVAQEVKTLADQSKNATSQVRGILGEVQKAISAAVMATEQGGRAVEAGVNQSAAAGAAITTLAGSAAEASQAAAQVAASSQQQLAGMDQLAQAMENIKTATGQNATASRQTEASTKDLQQLGQKLRHLAEQYKI